MDLKSQITSDLDMKPFNVLFTEKNVEIYIT